MKKLDILNDPNDWLTKKSDYVMFNNPTFLMCGFYKTHTRTKLGKFFDNLPAIIALPLIIMYHIVAWPSFFVGMIVQNLVLAIFKLLTKKWKDI
jgi:hypothetical protein